MPGWGTLGPEISRRGTGGPPAQLWVLGVQGAQKGPWDEISTPPKVPGPPLSPAGSPFLKLSLHSCVSPGR